MRGNHGSDQKKQRSKDEDDDDDQRTSEGRVGFPISLGVSNFEEAEAAEKGDEVAWVGR